MLAGVEGDPWRIRQMRRGATHSRPADPIRFLIFVARGVLRVGQCVSFRGLLWDPVWCQSVTGSRVLSVLNQTGSYCCEL